jgi:hypothetical protein
MKKSPLKRTSFKRKVKAKKKRKSKTPLKKQEELLDDLWRTVIRLRDNGIDQYTLKAKGIVKQGIDAHHIITRSRKSTRWDLDNGILLSAAHQWTMAHKEPNEFKRFLESKWFDTPDAYNQLEIRSQWKGRKADRNLWEIYLIDRLQKYAELPMSWMGMSQSAKFAWLKELRKSALKTSNSE